MKKIFAIILTAALIFSIFIVEVQADTSAVSEKSWLVFGDSVSTVSSPAMSTFVEKKYYNLIDERSNITAYAFNKINNKAGSVVGGTGFMRTTSANNNAYWQRVENLPDENYDFITIMGGFNDYNYYNNDYKNHQFGTVGDETTDTFCGCVWKTLELMKNKYSNSQIIIVSEYYSPSRSYLSQYNINEVLKTVANEFGFLFIDLFTPTYSKALDPQIIIPTFDKTHANAEGHKTIANMMLRYLSVEWSDVFVDCPDSVSYNYNKENKTLTLYGDECIKDYKEDTVPWGRVSSEIENLVISSDIKKVGSYAFYGCNNLKSNINLSNVSYIGDNAFSGCNSLESISVYGSVNSLSDDMFYGCSNLKRIRISSSVCSLGNIFTGFNTDNLVVYGARNSEIYRYCTEKNIDFCYSDINRDWVTDSTDLVTITRLLAGFSGYNEESFDGDIDNDGCVSVMDAAVVARKVAGWDGY